MLRSWSNTLVSVRQATQRNAGRETAGVDGKVALTDPARQSLAVRVHQQARSWRPLPVKRVYIPKAQSGKLRPLGIPVIADRCHQGRVRNALEPEWEARFEPKSYGFRPGRSCQDAIAAIYTTIARSRATRLWVLDADLSAAFDRIDHHHLLAQLGSFPGRELIRLWLKAGVFEAGKGFAPTREGTPQGGVISPLLLNVALHGLEEAAGVRYYTTARSDGATKPDSPVLVRYADDLVALCHSQAQAQQVKAKLAAWLAPRGLTFNEAKTRIVHASDGFDFLGFNVRRFRGVKLIITPSTAAIKRVRARLSTQMRTLRGGNAAGVLAAINPIVRGWAAYYRGVVSSKAFAALDNHMWRLTYKWARHSHPNKSRWWAVDRYFGTFHPTRQDRWVFGDRNSGAYLLKFSWTKIVRHPLVDFGSSPDDPDLAEYWAKRRQRNRPPLDRTTLRLLQKQHGRCTLCGDLLLHADRTPHTPEGWEQWLRATREAITQHHLIANGTPTTPDSTHLVHTTCHHKNPAPTHTRTP
jgi:RNA-directed DNA polymerase